MDFADLKAKSKAELSDLLKEFDQKLFVLRLQAHSRRLKQVHEISVMRRAIARVHMLLDTK
ncbi:MAG: 50S ribosomal protein L29 [Patescibacteria group bacterium]